MNQILVVEDENWLAMELAWLVQEAATRCWDRNGRWLRRKRRWAG
jgi:hypothetical protein